MTCVTTAPATLDDALAVINACATAAGGADWIHLAILGAQTVAVVFAVVGLLGFALARLAR